VIHGIFNVMNRVIAKLPILILAACGAPESSDPQEPEALGIVSRPGEAAELSPALTGSPPELDTTEVTARLTLDRAEVRVEGSITRPRGHQRYTFTVYHRRQVTISVEGEGGELDPTVELIDEAGQRVAFDDDSGEGTNASVSAELSEGNYEILVRGFRRSTGSFLLTLR
jgi:hypothetical protein